MDVRLTWTDCDEAGDSVVSNVFSPRYQVSRPDNIDETVLHTNISEKDFQMLLAVKEYEISPPQRCARSNIATTKKNNYNFKNTKHNIIKHPTFLFFFSLLFLFLYV